MIHVTYRARVYVTLKEGVLDPQGKAVRQGLIKMGYTSVDEVHVGRYILLNVRAASEEEARQAVDEMCRRLLVNPVIENYQFELSR